MVSLFKKLFGKSEQPHAVKVAEAAIPEPSSPVPSVEVTHLSLAAILSKLPEDLLPSVIRQPDEGATVVLPVATILKQLPAGAVRMSLASLRRQSPEGTFHSTKLEEKRLINVPLPEVFRHIKPETLPRRPGQRTVTIDDGGLTLFGNAQNRFEVAPAVSLTDSEADPVTLSISDVTDGPLKMDATPPPPVAMVRRENGTHAQSQPTAIAPNGIEPQRVIAPPPDMGGLRLAQKAPEPAEEVVSEPANAPAISVAPKPDTRTEPASNQPAPQPQAADSARLVLPLAKLSAGWPDAIRAELAQLDSEATIALPIGEIKAGLASGRIAFRWTDLRSWINPAVSVETTADADLSLILPLKAVAPAYLAANKNDTSAKRTVTVDQSIPALFTPAAPEQHAEVTVDAPVVSPACEPQPELPTTGSQPEPCGVDSQAEPQATDPEPATAADEQPLAAVADPQPEAPVVAEVINEPESEPKTVSGKLGQLFGKPDKTQWTPADIVEQTLHLPGVCGAIIALQEGLQVAHSLPEGIKSEVVAAFLPQIFARLNQYAEEMKLGEVDDLLFTTHGAHCQIYRLGFLYFAVLGRPGEPLPWRELRVIAEELARETKP